MMFFVPAGYISSRPWYSTDSTWFAGQADLKVGGIVSQIKAFMHSDEDAQLLVLNYAPGLRRRLHRLGIFDANYWSFFDALQGLEDDYTRPLNFLDLEWPDDVSFHYNPFLVTVMREDHPYARVYLSREGTLQSIRFYGSGMPMVERVFDDRGFPSSVLMFDENGQPASQYYMNKAGDVIVSEDVPSGQIIVVQNDDDRFEQPFYDSWGELCGEFLSKHLASHGNKGAGDTLVLGLSPHHNNIVAGALTDQTLVLSRSTAIDDDDTSADLIARAGAVFTDTRGTDAADDDPLAAFDEWALKPTLTIYPLERRPTFGASANEATDFISLFVDTMSMEELDMAIATMAGQLVDDEKSRLLVCTMRSNDVDYIAQLKTVIGAYQNFDLSFLGDELLTQLGADLGATETPEEKIQITYLDKDADLLATMAKTRVFVDLGQPVNYRLATEAVNAGVPQINRYEQEFITRPINGYVVSDLSDLGTALNYYLGGLEHWNQSLVQCRVLQDLFRPSEILDRWELLKGVAA
ncbi:MAG: accessory Sec system protein Asp1 [Cellulomonadaceae bacterium]|jgi:accessory secretory protein Asp1|nr:accessory Sec system protein Asp1 [Cellulomonadaceae bacterium]